MLAPGARIASLCGAQAVEFAARLAKGLPAGLAFVGSGF